MDNTIAVYIDGDNISPKYAEIIMDEIKNYGRIIISRVYGDYSKTELKSWLGKSTNCGIIPIQCCRISGKNSSDMKLCVDLMEDLYTLPDITLFYIVTNDSDYRHVISKIKIRNKKVNCIGSYKANMSLISMCDIYTKIEVLTEINNKDKKIKDKEVKKIPKSYSKVIEELLLDKDSINLSLVKDKLTSKYSFDLREWRCKNMTKFIEKYLPRKFKITTNKSGRRLSLI